MTSNESVLEIDLEAHTVRKGAKFILLSPTEWKLLRFLAQHKNQVLPYKRLLQTVWGGNYTKELNYLYVYIGRLRKKLEDDVDEPRYLLTVPGIGYQWVDWKEEESPAGSNSVSKPELHNAPPAPLTSFIGRESEFALLERLIRKRAVRLLTLTGPGGIGKTRLSVEIATHLHDLQFFPDGIHFVDLEPIDKPEFVVSAIAQTVGIREKPGEDLLSSLRRYLYGKTTLIVLDNFEHVRAAANQVLEILKASHTVKFLVTSRERLDLDGEHTLEIPPLSLTPRPDSAQSEAVPSSEAVQLFVERAQAADAYFELDSENVSVVQQICDRLEGLPLAIELAAVNSRFCALPELLRRLDHRLKALAGGQASLPARHRTLHATIDWSYQLLNASDQALFVCLSVFNGSFTLEAVEAVYGESGQEQTGVEQGLNSLLNKSLLKAQWDNGQDTLRYGMPGIFREFGGKYLGKEDAGKYGCRHAEYYLSQLEMSSRTQLEWLTLELGNLRAALGWAITNQSGELALGLSVGMYDLWQRLGILREGKQRLFEALDVTRSLETPLRAHGLTCAGALADWLGEPLVAQGLYRESLRLYEVLEDAVGISSTLHLLASALINQGDYIEGRARSEQALSVAREYENSYAVALALSNLGMVAIYQGEVHEAQQFYEEMLSVCQANDYVSPMGWALTGLSWVELLHGKYDAAQNYINQSLAIHQSSDMLSAATALVCDSWITLYQANVAIASGKLAACLTLCKELGLVQLSIWPLVGLARINLHLGNAPQARASLEEALNLCQQLNFPPMTTWVYIAFGKLHRLEGDLETAFDELDRALTLSRKRDDKSALVTGLEEFAAHFAAQTKIETVAKLYGAAEALRATYCLPLPKLDSIERDQVLHVLRSNKNVYWNVHWQKGRSLDWDEITRLIYQRPDRSE
jgi:predicted ATPase/DNA-binding winged helix-turn-helix (wHTH) protein